MEFIQNKDPDTQLFMCFFLGGSPPNPTEDFLFLSPELFPFSAPFLCEALSPLSRHPAWEGRPSVLQLVHIPGAEGVTYLQNEKQGKTLKAVSEVEDEV